MTVFADENLIMKTQDVVAAVSGAAHNLHARGMMWDWLKSKIGKLQEHYAGTGLMSSILASIIPVVCLGRVSETETYFREHIIPDAEIGIKVGLEKLRVYDRLTKEIMGES